MADESKPIRIVLINGSVRPGNYTSMASALVVDELRKDPKVSVEVINPLDLDLPLPGINPHAEGTRKLQEAVKNATAIILATPEYHGSLSSLMKLVIENLGFPSVLAGKPVALQSASPGPVGGARVQYDLRRTMVFLDALTLNKPEIFIGNCAQRIDDKTGKITDEATVGFIKQQLAAFAKFIAAHGAKS